MRSTIFVILALLLTSGGFLAYHQFQKPIARLLGRGAPPDPQVLDPRAPTVGRVGQGERPFSRVFDKEGRLSSRFRAAEVQPRGSGRIHVITVEAEFYQYLKPSTQFPKGRVQLIRIEGEDGDMEIQDTAEGSRGAMEKGSQAAPRRGRLNHVIMKLYRDFQDRQLELKQPGRGGPMLTLTTNNISFDNELFEVATQSYKGDDGNAVPADEVPIHVTGDYLFEGRGLKLRWNDVEGRLDYLDVAHGEKLVVLHPRDLPGSAGGAEPDAPKQKTAALTDASGEPIMLAARDKKAAALAQPKEPPAPRPAAARGNRSAAKTSRREPEKPDRHGLQPPYRATFIDDVHVTQGHENVDEREVAVADVMNVDFQMGGSSKATTQPSTRPATAPTTAPAAAATSDVASGGTATTQPGEALAQAGPATTQPTTGPSTQPASPDEEPVIVRWTGPLKMAPIEADTPNASLGLKAGESVLHLIGMHAPVVLTRETNKVRCGSMDYYSADGSVSMHSSQLVPQIVMTQTAVPPSDPGAGPAADGQKGPKPGSGQDATIVTESLVYSGTDRIAVLSGPGSAQVAMKPASAGSKSATRPATDAAAPPDELDATWTRSARLYFAPGSKDAREGLTLEHATLLGDVDVTHPQLAMRSQALDLLFDRPTAQPAATAPTTAPVEAIAVAATTQPAVALAQAKEKKPDQQQPELKRIIASDHVWCDLKDEKGKRQTVLGDELDLETAHDKDGKLYPRLVNVDGNAHAFDATQDLKAGHIAMTLVPSKKAHPTTGPATMPAGAETAGVALAAADPKAAVSTAATSTTRPASAAAGGLDTASVELETMTARDHVNAVSADGATATGDELYVVMHDGQPNTRLIGRSAPAKVVDPKQNVVIGPLIRFDGRQDVAAVEGQGHLHLMRQDDPADKPRPVDIAFVQGALVNSPANRIFVYGPVAVVTAEADGAVTTLTGRNATIELADRPPAPATQPAARAVIASGPGGASVSPARPDAVAAAATFPSTRPSKRHKDDAGSGGNAPEGMKMDLMKDKDVRAVVFQQDAVVKSTLTAADGSVLREFELKSALIRYELIGGAPVQSTMTSANEQSPGQQKPRQLGKLIVPVPGTMLVRDHRPPEKKPAGGAAPNDGGLGGGNTRGAMAFQWDHDLVYDESTRTAVMNGNVVSVFQSDDPKEPRAQLNADQVTALFEPKAPAPKAPAGAQPSPAPRQQQQQPQPQPAEAPASLQLRWLTALGHATVNRAGAVLTANRIDYDPLSSELVATGADRDPARYRDATGVNATAAEQILWNTQTWLIKAHNLSARTTGAPPPKPTPGKPLPQQAQPQQQRRR